VRKWTAGAWQGNHGHVTVGHEMQRINSGGHGGHADVAGVVVVRRPGCTGMDSRWLAFRLLRDLCGAVA